MFWKYNEDLYHGLLVIDNVLLQLHLWAYTLIYRIKLFLWASAVSCLCKNWELNGIICMSITCVCACMCVYIHIYMYMGRERFLPVFIVFIIKTRWWFLFYLNNMESYPKFCFSLGIRKHVKLLLKVYSRCGRIKMKNYSEVHWGYGK